MLHFPDKVRVTRAAVVLAICACMLSALGQTTPVDDAPIRIDTLLLNIPVIVSDHDGRYISGLRKEDFVILLDGQKQEVDYLADADVPLTVSIVLDISGSTRPYAEDIVKGARAFIDQLRPDDQAMIVTFDVETDVVCPLTSNKAKLKKKLSSDLVNDHLRDLSRTIREAAKHSTGGPVKSSNMYDAVYQVLTSEMAAVKGRKAVIILTDGFVTGTVSQTIFDNALIDGDTLVYPVMFLTALHLPPHTTTISVAELYAHAPGSVLNRIAGATGGRMLIADKNISFKKAFENVADELRKQYIVGFYPSKIAGSPHITINIDRPDAKLRTKRAIRLKPGVGN